MAHGTVADINDRVTSEPSPIGSGGAEVSITETFENMMLKTELLRGIRALSLEYPSPFQQKVTLPIINGHDIVVNAQSGSGKTIGFVISALQRIDTTKFSCQVLILAPTREAAQHIKNFVDGLSHFMGIKSCALIGGSRMQDTVAALEQGCQLAVGTPGRVLDCVQRILLATDDIRLVVVDGADEISWNGLITFVSDILQSLSKGTQFVLVSPSMPDNVVELTRKFMLKPLRISVWNENSVQLLEEK
ncbi:translation initiation factor eIF4A [Orbilia ellipsospora]|uniref:RNA helicase n=1 Tax=Orbilia ellipsospora TaxID=2528407 RepID=A0AAV9X567_9PEZI